MKIALLNARIEIQESQVQVDAYGNHRNEWVTIFTCHATLSGERAYEEQFAAGQTEENGRKDFTIRWCPEADRIGPDTHRILFRGSVYNILGIDHMNNIHKAIKLHCQKVRR